VWSQNEVAGDQVHDIYVGDLIAVDLPENRTTGYRWFISESEYRRESAIVSSEEPLSPTALDRFRLEQPRLELSENAAPSRAGAEIIGAGGRRQLLIRANSVGKWKLTLSYAPVQSPNKPIDSVIVEGKLHLRPGQEQRRILLETYRAVVSGENA
jgi:predicted secreted protein